MRSNDSFVNNEWGSFGQISWLDSRSSSGTWRVGKDFNGLPAWICKTVGGSTDSLGWRKFTHSKITNLELKLNTVISMVQILLDWPLTLKDLEPYYAKAEDKMGVTRTNGIPGLPGNNNFKVMHAGATKVRL